MTAKVFEAALGIATPWSVVSVEFDEAAKRRKRPANPS